MGYQVIGSPFRGFIFPVRAVECPRTSNRIKEERHSELAEESRSRQWAARMTPARLLGKLGMTFFLIDYGYLCATAYYRRGVHQGLS